MVKCTFCGKNQLLAILAGAFVMNGLPMAAKDCPKSTHPKSTLMKRRAAAPSMVKIKPK